MDLSRRQFILYTATVGVGCVISRAQGSPSSIPTDATTQSVLPPGVVDAGPLAEFKDDDVYDAFREQGFFVIRRDETLFALSSVCTHKGCKVRVQGDLSFLCKCHGSRFDKDGHVIKGPARRDLPRLAVATDGQKHLLIDPARRLQPPPPELPTTNKVRR
jgi:Rieske Fe-S protein